MRNLTNMRNENIGMKQNDIFKLKKDLNPTIKRGMVGVILEIYNDNVFEVEFVDKDGRNFEYDGKFTFTIDKNMIE